MKDREGGIAGLTYRVGRHVPGGWVGGWVVGVRWAPKVQGMQRRRLGCSAARDTQYHKLATILCPSSIGILYVGQVKRTDDFLIDLSPRRCCAGVGALILDILHALAQGADAAGHEVQDAVSPSLLLLVRIRKEAGAAACVRRAAPPPAAPPPPPPPPCSTNASSLASPRLTPPRLSSSQTTGRSRRGQDHAAAGGGQAAVGHVPVSAAQLVVVVVVVVV